MIKNTKSIIDLQLGNNGTISHFADIRIASRMMAMGVLPGTEIQLIRHAPFNGAYYLKVGDHPIALRQKEAACILLK